MKQPREHGYKLYLREFTADTGTGTICPGDESPSFRLDEYFFCYARCLLSRLVGCLEPAARTPCKGVWPPYFGIGVQRLHVDVDRRIWGEDMRSIS